MDTLKKDNRIHFGFPSEHGPVGISMTQEEIAIVNKMQKEHPGKYQGVEGIMQAIIDYRSQNQG